MDKSTVQKQYEMDLERSKYYQKKYIRCEKAIREYEHFRQKYLQHNKMAVLYALILQNEMV
jgi:hypothetical protein